MQIAIKSEADSRILLYSLVKVLYNYGTIAIYTSNKTLSRLIENELEGGFRNVRIVISPEADLEAMKESDEWYEGKYDFMIYDNCGAVDYDILIAILTNRISESYLQDLQYIISDDKTHILKFGKAAPKIKEKKPAKSKEKDTEPTPEEEENNREFNKWHVEKTDEEILHDVLSNHKDTWLKFPSFDVIEEMEGRHKFPKVDDTTIKELHRLLESYLNVDLRMFTKGARVADEGSSDINGTDVW